MGLHEAFNIADFCELVKKGVFKKIRLCLARQATFYYRRQFMIALGDLKNAWNIEKPFPMIKFL